MKTFKELLEKTKKKGARDLKKILESSDFGYTESGGNGRVKIKGKTIIIYDGFWADSERYLKNLIKSWQGGENYKYFSDEGFNFKIIDSGVEYKCKAYKGEPAVYVTLEFS